MTPEEVYNLNKSTHLLMQGPFGSAAQGATAAAPKAAKHAKKKKAKKKK